MNGARTPRGPTKQVPLSISFFCVVTLCSASMGHAQPVATPPDDAAHALALDLTRTPWSGDFDQMLERRVIRVLVPYSRTLYFNDRGRERGITADFVRDFERYINKKYVKQLRKRPLTIVMIPGTRDRMFQDVADGLGDIAAGNLTVTADRLKVVDFVSPPELPHVSELVLTGPSSPPIDALDDLAGKTVHVRQASSYFESLLAFNRRLQEVGKPPVGVALLPAELEDEDIMEMLNAGQLDLIVVKDWLAKMWTRVLPKIQVRTDIILQANERIGWAIRKKSPRLDEELRHFFAN